MVKGLSIRITSLASRSHAIFVPIPRPLVLLRNLIYPQVLVISGEEGQRVTAKILIIEDHFLIAMEIENVVLEAGYEVCGIAASKQDAMLYATDAELALVDVNLNDGATGPEIGEYLASQGKTVVFMTGNPEMVAHGVPGTVGVMQKPVQEVDLHNVLRFLVDHHRGRKVPPPPRIKMFA